METKKKKPTRKKRKVISPLSSPSPSPPPTSQNPFLYDHNVNTFDDPCVFASESNHQASYELRCCSPDGNCFYRAISLHLFGSEDYHHLVRFMITATSIYQRHYFATLYESNQMFQQYLAAQCQFLSSTEDVTCPPIIEGSTYDCYVLITYLGANICILNSDSHNKYASYYVQFPGGEGHVYTIANMTFAKQDIEQRENIYLVRINNNHYNLCFELGTNAERLRLRRLEWAQFYFSFKLLQWNEWRIVHFWTQMRESRDVDEEFMTLNHKVENLIKEKDSLQKQLSDTKLLNDNLHHQIEHLENQLVVLQESQQKQMLDLQTSAMEDGHYNLMAFDTRNFDIRKCPKIDSWNHIPFEVLPKEAILEIYDTEFQPQFRLHKSKYSKKALLKRLRFDWRKRATVNMILIF